MLVRVYNMNNAGLISMGRFEIIKKNKRKRIIQL